MKKNGFRGNTGIEVWLDGDIVLMRAEIRHKVIVAESGDKSLYDKFEESIEDIYGILLAKYYAWESTL